MNKQEALKRIEVQKETLIRLTGWAVYVYIEELIKSLDEPEKVKVPQCVADWITHSKNIGRSLFGAMSIFEENFEIKKENLMFWGMFIACLLISAMTFYIMHSQAMVNRDLARKYYDLKQEISRVFGWDEYDWANNFRDYARKVEELIKFKKEIEQLEIIKKALEVKSLEELQKKKEQIESVIKTLEK